MGTVRAVEAAIPFLETAAATKGDAAIVILSSAAVAEADYESAYGAMKAALIHFSKGVARRLAPKGVRTNVISPGTIYVPDGFWANAQQHMPELYEMFLKRNPMGRMGCPKEIAKVAAFLASPLASFTTGANIVVDGAFTSRVQY
jgi:3-oxoacyl-[acyl-carrier protein] reductase